MRQVITRFTVVIAVLMTIDASAESLSEYANSCASELGFDASDIPVLDCNDGHRFLGPFFNSRIFDFVDSKRINDNVDLTVACRWLQHGRTTAAGRRMFDTAISLEMIIHNRNNGSTCFFAAKSQSIITTPEGRVIVDVPPTGPGGILAGIVSTAIVSPFSANASSYWMEPADLDSKVFDVDGKHADARLRCVGCHVAGPYIASDEIAPFLSHFGLLNNGHDTFADMTSSAPHYHAVGSNPYNNPNGPASTSAFKAWDSIIYGNMNHDPITGKPDADCSGACHSIGRKSTANDIADVSQNFDFVIQSLRRNIEFIEAVGSMPADADPYSDYRWVNMDHPSVQNPTGDGDFETSAWLQKNYPRFYCSNPSDVTAHVAGDATLIDLATFPNKLKTFNLHDGVVCLNSEQGAGKTCRDYDVRYLCSDGTWSSWYNTDSPTYDGDHEERSRHANICAPTSQKPTLTAMGIQARAYKDSINGPVPMAIANGANDRLYQFDLKNGLVCRNQDQPNGKACSNYVVRFHCDGTAPQPTFTFKSVWTGRVVTSTGATSDTKAQPLTTGWNTQGWTLEPVASTPYFRLKSTGAGTAYLYAQSSAESAKVVTYGASSSTLEQWAIEPISNSSEVRIRNVGANRYLTLADAALMNVSPDYAPIFSQALSPNNWSSQRWIIQ